MNKKKEIVRKLIIELLYDKKTNTIDLSNLDFSDYNVTTSYMKTKDLYQRNQTVNGDLRQGFQNVCGNLYQNVQTVKKSLWQGYCEVGEHLYQSEQKVKGDLFPNCRSINGYLFQSVQNARGKKVQDDRHNKCSNCKNKKSQEESVFSNFDWSNIFLSEDLILTSIKNEVFGCETTDLKSYLKKLIKKVIKENE